MINWQRPAKPTPTTGRMVFHSDDGRLPDYIYYYKIIKRSITRYNQFNPLKSGIFCPAVNSGYVDSGWHETVGLPMMNWDMLQEIAHNGGEVLSHGQYHLYLDHIPPSQVIDDGAAEIRYTRSEGRPREGYKYYITEAGKRDDYTVLSYVHLGTGLDNHMTITPPLANSYTTSARIYLHPDSVASILSGMISQCAAKGIEVKHHVNAWYNSSAEATAIQRDYVQSVVRTSQYEIENPETADVYALKRTPDLRSLTLEQCDIILNNVQSSDGVAFIQLHGVFNNPQMLRNSEYMVTQAMLKGVRNVTHSEAIEYIKSKQG